MHRENNKPEMKNKSKVQMKSQRNQQTISEAFKKLNEKKEDLPSRIAVKEMWKELDVQLVRKKESEKKNEVLEKQSEERNKMNDLKRKELINKIKPEKETQQQIQNNNKNKQCETITTTTNLKPKKNENNSDLKPELDKKAKAKPNSKLRIQGKQISDIETLRDFLAKKKLERAERGANKVEACHTARSNQIIQRDKPSNTGEPEREPNQMKRGLEIAAKGTTAVDVTVFIGQNKP